jgi:hypothetical protein
MDCSSWIAVGGTLLGTIIGGGISIFNAKGERRNKFLRDQLTFYGSMLGMYRRIDSLTEFKNKVGGISSRVFEYKMRDLYRMPETDVVRGVKEHIHEEHNSVQVYREQILVEQILPLYKGMLKLWNENMALATKSTNEHYIAFVEFVEIWNMGLAKVGNMEIYGELNQKEDNVKPLYADLERNVDRLQRALTEQEDFGS